MNFALILFCLLILSGAIWVADIFFLRKHRPADAKDPWWVEYGASFFPVILLVFVLRSFIVEPFKIPSASMLPTLHVGDFILVNKYTYGIRLPVINKKIIAIHEPQRGDVMGWFSMVGTPGFGSRVCTTGNWRGWSSTGASADVNKSRRKRAVGRTMMTMIDL